MNSIQYVKSKYSYSPETNILKPVMYWSCKNRLQKKQWEKGILKLSKNDIENGLIVDFGKEVGGYLNVHWGTIQSSAIKFYFSESLEELEPLGDVIWEPFFSRLPIFYQHTYRGSGNTLWRDSTLRGGFRYLLIKTSYGVKVEIKDIFVEADFYIPEKGTYPGFFECSDSQLNRIWHGAAYTMQVSTKHPWESFVYGKGKAGCGEWVIFDGAKRDRAVWTLDLSICIPSYLLSLGNADAVRDSLLTLLSQKGKGGFAFRSEYIPHSAFPVDSLPWIPITLQTFSVYLLWWIRGVYSYYLYTGDEEFVKSVFKHINQGLNWIESQTKKSPQSKTPLFYANGFNDLSWDYTIWRRGFSGTTNLIFAKTLEETSWLAAKVVKDKSISLKYFKRAVSIRKAVFEKGFKPYNLWDSNSGRFRHTTRDDEPFVQEVNAQAILYDFVKGKKASCLLNLMREKLHVKWGALSSDKSFKWVLDRRHNCKVMPSLVAFEVAALMKYGRFTEALNLTRRTWLHMLESGTASTFWEWYGDSGKIANNFVSLCHPWSSWILEVLNENLTGIKPLNPANHEFQLNVLSLILCKEIKYAKFRIPTPQGIIYGQWHKEKQNIIFEAQLPDKVKLNLTPETIFKIFKDEQKAQQFNKLRKKVNLRFKLLKNT